MFSGAYYHIFNRGVNRGKIYFNRGNYDFFMQRYWSYTSDSLETISYCLMPNHFHFLVRVKDTPENNPPEGVRPQVIQSLSNFFNSYVRAVNKQQDRVGPLFQGKFKRIHVTEDDYLRRLVVYIHQNPVKAGICDLPQEWKHSSYRKIISDEATMLQRLEAIELFGDLDNFRYCHGEISDAADFDWGS